MRRRWSGPRSISPGPWGWTPPSSPIVDARLEDGSRVAICVPPASPCVAITVRRFGKRAFSAGRSGGARRTPRKRAGGSRARCCTPGGISWFQAAPDRARPRLLNALIELLPDDERIVAIEDTLELRIDRSNCVRFEARGLQDSELGNDPQPGAPRLAAPPGSHRGGRGPGRRGR